ncbi:hypothetical protein GCM10007977_099620 [Dactylosporangium sucinum]|uniref:Putative restriction endonuclease domain-containing protein n=3 Tax=Dactylosporangium sucinum TaxID=1424081 RepID=A0A917UCP8_9ACTN|nr:hypothetical protein GCM10007977_099620 [Dactylosporangium sucinum]
MLIELPDDWALRGELTVADVLAMREPEGFKVELHEGVPKMTPPPFPAHQRASGDLLVYFDRIGREAYHDIGVRFDDRHYRVPDVSVIRMGSTASDDNVQAPDIIDIVVEIVSRGSVDEDRVVKPKLYARFGIPEYWRAERAGDDWSVLMHRLEDGRYVLVRTVLLSELVREAG